MSDKMDEATRAEQKGADRRLFLKGAGVAAVAMPIAAASAQTLKPPTNHQVGARYQESEHVKRFYELNRR